LVPWRIKNERANLTSLREGGILIITDICCEGNYCVDFLAKNGHDIRDFFWWDDLSPFIIIIIIIIRVNIGMPNFIFKKLLIEFWFLFPLARCLPSHGEINCLISTTILTILINISFDELI